MAALGVGLSDIFTALTKASANATGGYVERGSEMFVIRSLGIFHDMPDLELVRVASHEGIPVTVRRHRHGDGGLHPAPGHRHARRQRGRRRGIVLMRRGENPTVVLDGLSKRITELNSRILPRA